MYELPTCKERRPQNNISDVESWPVRESQRLLSQVYAFLCQPRLTICNIHQEKCENPYGDSYNRGDSTAIALQKTCNHPEECEWGKPIDQRSLIPPLIFLFVLVAIPIIGWLGSRKRPFSFSHWHGNVKSIMLFTKVVKRYKKYLIPKD
jgi:hypothetical protein